MNGIKLVIDIFGVACELVIIHYYFTYLMHETLVSKTLSGILYGGCSVIMTALTLIPGNQFILPLLNLALIFFISFAFRGKWYIRLFFSTLLIIMFALSELVIGAAAVFVTKIDIGNLQENLLFYMVGMLASNAACFSFNKISWI